MPLASMYKPVLRLSTAATFKIAVFSDLHYGENEDSFGITQDIDSTGLMYDVLNAEIPDFVVLDGDLITGENTFDLNSTKYIDKIVQQLVKGSYKWASTYGNHDSKYNLSRESMLVEEQKYPFSYTQHGSPRTSGVTDYVLPMYDTTITASNAQSAWQSHLSRDCSKNERPVAILYFLDSRGGSQGDPENND